MAQIIEMPKLSDTMTEGVIAAWHKKVGDPVKAGELLAEIETDKATMELESFHNGTLLYIGVEKGQGVPVGNLLAIIGQTGENVEEAIAGYKAKGNASVSQPKEEKSTVEHAQANVSGNNIVQTTREDDRIKASPLAKAIAREKGVDLSQVQGSGDHGRIIKRDVEAALSNGSVQKSSSGPALQTAFGMESYEEVMISQMRKTIARRLTESKNSAPHFYLTMEIRMDRAVEARKSLNEISPVKLSFNDLVIKAVAAALKRHPMVNASWLGDKIRYNKHVHIGMAVAIEDGLIVPVIRHADMKSLSVISEEARSLAERARNRQLQPAEWEGNTFTISNLGMFGIEEFTAIINPPDACILAIGGIIEKPVVSNGQVVPGHVMKVTLSCDHRVVDGALGSAFLQTLKNYLENPLGILL